MRNNTEKKILIYLPESFADWEGAFLLAELAKNKIDYTIVSDSENELLSIGHLKVRPDAFISDFEIDQIRGLVLIGSDSWTDPTKNHKAINLAGNLLKNDILVAAICGSTFALARADLLDNRKHTSNDLNMLKMFVPNYDGQTNYIDQLAVTDKNLITASGVGPIEFTFEVMKYLNIYNDKKRKQWFDLFKNGVKPSDDFWS